MPRFSEIDVPRPEAAGLAERYRRINALLDAGTDTARREALAERDAAQAEFRTWTALAYIRFQQDTSDATARADNEHADALNPVAQAHEADLKRRLLAERGLDGVAELVGAQAARLWQLDIAAFAPAIADDLVREAALAARYSGILGSARIEIGGETVNLSGLEHYGQSPDRAVRQEAARLRWGFVAEHGVELDQIFAELVALRHKMARILGDANFVAQGYRRNQRTDYGPGEAAAYRDRIVASVVPLVGSALERRRAQFGWDRVRAWDERIIDPRGNPAPKNGAGLSDTMIGMFRAIDPRLGSFVDAMAAGGYLDLDSRPAKAPAYFCTGLPSAGMPFVFAGGSGTYRDVEALIHEMGHAFQNWSSRALAPIEYHWPTMDACEVHSMSLELLAHPHVECLYGDRADQYRELNLVELLDLMAYCAAADHFQHLVYEQPEATAAERHAMWLSVERRYLPWRDYGDLPHPAAGGAWQRMSLVFTMPFYAIDYALAGCVALELWARSQTDPAGTFTTYAALCAKGGTGSFLELVEGTGLTSPFAPGALERGVAAAAAALGLA